MESGTPLRVRAFNLAGFSFCSSCCSILSHLGMRSCSFASVEIGTGLFSNFCVFKRRFAAKVPPSE
jgi:hypothetical protein